MVDLSKLANRYVTIIEAATDSVESAAYELMGDCNYTISCTPLGVNEEVVIHVFDPSTDSFYPYFFGGNQVKLAYHHEEIDICTPRVIKLFKSETVQEVGVTISYKGSRFLSIKPIEE